MERIELPGGMYLEISTEAKDAFNLRGHGKNWLNNVAREKAIEFASYMNTSQAELAKVQEQLRVAVEALEYANRNLKAINSSRTQNGKNDIKEVVCDLTTALQQIAALKGEVR